MRKKGIALVLIGVSFLVLYIIESKREHKEEPKLVKLFKNILSKEKK